MIVYDSLYGKFALPTYLSGLVHTPEVRRLSQIRLLNTLTPSLATLGELRRFSHTLGVLYLCEKNRSPGFSEEERKALAASVLLHDIGTPPFGHLMEYYLRELSDWSHEGVIRAMLAGTHVPENRAHQIFAHRQIGFPKALRKAGVSEELVKAIITGSHPLSLLLFGTLDLDNLDNVARMTRALGFGGGSELAIKLASALKVSRDARLWLNEASERSTVEAWAKLRERAYDIIVFDPPTVAAQAVLSQAIEIALGEGIITKDDWTLSDEQLLETLMRHQHTKGLIILEYLGKLPEIALCLQVRGTLQDLGLAGRAQAKILVEQILHEEFDARRVRGYVFVDSGTFAKRLEFLDPETGEAWEIGQKSRSIVFYGFIHSPERLAASKCERAMQLLTSKLKVGPDKIMRCQIGNVLEAIDEYQRSLNLASSQY
jgi:hypothetical protein